MDSNYNNKFYEIEFNHKVKQSKTNFKKELYFESYLNLKDQGIPEFFEFYEMNNAVIDSEYKGIIKKQNFNYEGFSKSNEKVFSEKINSKIILYERNPQKENANSDLFFKEIENSITDSINNLSGIVNSKDSKHKFYCKICDINCASEKNHFTEVQNSYKIYLEKGFESENQIAAAKDFDFFKPHLPEKVYNFKPFELKLTSFYKILKSDLFRKYTIIIFDNLHEIIQAHSIQNNNDFYNTNPAHNPYTNLNANENHNLLNMHLIENPYAQINLNNNNNNITKSNITITTESKLTFEIINYYTIQDSAIANLTSKLNILQPNFLNQKNFNLKNPDESKEIETLKGFLDFHFGEAETYIGGMLKSKKKEMQKRLSTGSLLPIFNFSKLCESDKKLINDLFPEANYPHYKIKEIKPSVPDKEVSHCGICETKFGLLFTRKHHCRVCGSIFCDNCLVWSRVPFLGYMSRVRVCCGCQALVRKELAEAILDDLLETVNNFYLADANKKAKKKKIFVLIGLLRKIENFSKWAFLGYELINKLMCGLAVVCFKYEGIELDEWFNLAVLFCKKGLYKKAFKCLQQVNFIEFKNLKNSEKKIFLFEKSEFYKFKAKENLEIFGVLWFFSFYLHLALEESDEMIILNQLMHKAFKLEQEQFYFLSKMLVYFIKEQYLSEKNPNKKKNEILVFEYAVEFLQRNQNDFFFLNFFAILNVPLDSWLNLLLKFLSFESFNLIKADVVHKCIQYFYPNTNLNFVDNKKYKKILFYNLAKVDFHVYNPDYWLESFFLNPEINEKGDNMILLLFLSLFCNSYSLHDLSKKYFAEKKFEYAFLCNMLIAISENNNNYFLNLSESFYNNLDYDNAILCVFLSEKDFEEAGNLFASKKLFDLSISCFYQLGYEKTVELVLKLLSDLSFEDFLLCNYALLSKKLDEKVKIVLLSNLILALKDNEKLNNNNDYINLLCRCIKSFSNYLENNYIANLHLLLSEVFIEDNFEISMGALHSVLNKFLDEHFKNRFEKTLIDFNFKYAKIVYQKLAEGYEKNEPLIYFVNVLKQLNSSRIEQAHKFYLAIQESKFDESNEELSKFREDKKFILMKFLSSYKEKYLNNYRNALKDLFDVLIEFPNEEVYFLVTEVLKTESYFVSNSINNLINELRLIKENIKAFKNLKVINNFYDKQISNIPAYANFIDISFPNYSKENKKEILEIQTRNKKNKAIEKSFEINKSQLSKQSSTLNDLIKDYIPLENFELESQINSTKKYFFESQMNYFNFKQTAFDYLDIIFYLDNDLDKAQSLLLSIVFLLKEANRIQNANYINAIKKIILQLIYNVFYIAKNFSTGMTQLYFYKILLVVVLEITTTTGTSNFIFNQKSNEKLSLLANEILKFLSIAYKIFPFVNQNILSLENFSYLKFHKSNFLKIYLNGFAAEFANLENKYFSFENSRLSNDKKSFSFNLYEFKNFLFLKNKIDLAQTEKYLNYALLSRDANGFLSLNYSTLNLTWDSFSVFHGFKINFENKQIDFLLEKTNENLFTLQDIKEIYGKSIMEIALALNPCDSEFPVESFFRLDYAPKGAKDSNTLYTFFHADYLLKMLSMGVEISANFPFGAKGATNESFLFKKLPFDFRSKLEQIISKTQSRLLLESKCAKIWVECAKNEYNFCVDKYTDEALFSVFEPAFNVCTDEPALLGEFVQFLENHFSLLCACFPILNRFKELVKIMSSLHLLESTNSEQFYVNTKNNLIENQFSALYNLLPKLPSKYVNKLITVLKPELVSEFNPKTGRYETVSKLVSVQEWQNVYDPTDYNRQLALNCKEMQIKLRNIFNAEISDLKSVEKFCENPQAKFDLLNFVVGVIKSKRSKLISEALAAVKGKIDFNAGKVFGKEFENEKIVHIPSGVYNRSNNTIIYGGVHVKPNLVFNKGLCKSDRERSNSRYISI